MAPVVISESEEDEDRVAITRRTKRQVHFDGEGDDRVDQQQQQHSSSHRDRDKHVQRKKKKRLSNRNLQGSNGGYAWEDEIKRSWDLVKVDDEGDMASLVASILCWKGFETKQACHDYPVRHRFVHEFFDQNPISQMGIIIMRNGLAQLVSQVSGNPQDHIDALKSIRKQEPKGNPSLQNALEMARGLLLPVPAHCTREVLIVFGSLSTTDPGDIHQTIDSLVSEKIRVKVLGLSAQVAICKELCKATNYGDESFYKILLDETHLKELFNEAVTPLPVNKINKGFTLVKMGFPTRIFEDTPTFCSCHSKLVYGGYFCPNCHSKVCSLPTVCPCCDLMLILSTHLARSYHHLMPLKTFAEVPTTEKFRSEDCFSCQSRFPILKNHKNGKLLTSSRYRCEDCKQEFCVDCDVFIHEILHNCPGCESKPVIT
ncbi:Ssl1-like family protein [Saccharomyces cerevisiae]|nr:Ssl1-like family protein [Saccharomyces cerevisiae]